MNFIKDSTSCKYFHTHQFEGFFKDVKEQEIYLFVKENI
jgi:hypothetical protein